MKKKAIMRSLFTGGVIYILGAVLIMLALFIGVATHHLKLDRVLTGSMTPGIPVDSIVVGEPVDARNITSITTDQVVTYRNESRHNQSITHRVIGLSHKTDGQVLVTTKGDANQVADPAFPRDWIEGRALFVITPTVMRRFFIGLTIAITAIILSLLLDFDSSSKTKTSSKGA